MTLSTNIKLLNMRENKTQQNCLTSYDITRRKTLTCRLNYIHQVQGIVCFS